MNEDKENIIETTDAEPFRVLLYAEELKAMEGMTNDEMGVWRRKYKAELKAYHLAKEAKTEPEDDGKLTMGDIAKGIGGGMVLFLIVLNMMGGGAKSGSSGTPSPSQASAAKVMVRVSGYTCDSVDAVIPFALSEGSYVSCNGGRYSYDIANKGGNWIVTVN